MLKRVKPVSVDDIEVKHCHFQLARSQVTRHSRRHVTQATFFSDVTSSCRLIRYGRVTFETVGTAIVETDIYVTASPTWEFNFITEQSTRHHSDGYSSPRRLSPRPLCLVAQTDGDRSRDPLIGRRCIWIEPRFGFSLNVRWKGRLTYTAGDLRERNETPGMISVGLRCYIADDLVPLTVHVADNVYCQLISSVISKTR